jgi:broad specificity phosphatase PhoE
MRVYLVRHGQTAWNAERKNQGHTDIPLDEQGLEQARLLAASFDSPIARILTSDLRRAVMTAEPLAARHGVDIEVRKDLRERCFGAWEARPMEKVAQNFIEQELLTGRPREEIEPPDGESLLHVWGRLDKVVREIEASHEPMAVICHGGSGAVLLSRLLHGTLATSRSFRFDNTGITMIARRPDGGFHLMRYNDSSHLREQALSGSTDGVART